MKLSELPVGSKIKFGKYQVETEEPEVICWLVADQNHEDYPDNSTTLITEKIIDLRAFDAAEPNNEDRDRQNYGNNRWLYANINQWLNSDKEDWYIRRHVTDNTPSNDFISNETGYDKKFGFLYLFDEKEKEAILNTTLTTVKSNIDGGGAETSIFEPLPISKVFFPSLIEVGITQEGYELEGSQLKLFDDLVFKIGKPTQQLINYTLGTSKPKEDETWFWWLRTPYSQSSYNVQCMGSTGLSFLSSAYQGNIGIRPLLNLLSTLTISDTPDSDGYYTISFSENPAIASQKFQRVALINEVVSQSDINSLQTAVETNTSNISALADKIGSTQASANANSYDILTVIMALKDDWAGDIIGPGMYMDCLTDESTFTVTDGIYDSNNSYIYVN